MAVPKNAYSAPMQSAGDNDFDQNLVQVAALAGAGFALYSGGRRGGLRGILMTLLGSGILYSYATGRMPALGKLPVLNNIARQVHLHSIVHIDRSAEDIYRFWRDFPQLQQSMSYVKHIREEEPGHTRWEVQGPRGPALVWESEITEDVPNQRIAWRSLEGSQIHNEGRGEFRKHSNNRGTDVAVNLIFEPPGGTIGAAVGGFLNGLENSLLTQNLYDLKARLESGEIPASPHTSDTQSDSEGAVSGSADNTPQAPVTDKAPGNKAPE